LHTTWWYIGEVAASQRFGRPINNIEVFDVYGRKQKIILNVKITTEAEMVVKKVVKQ